MRDHMSTGCAGEALGLSIDHAEAQGSGPRAAAPTPASTLFTRSSADTMLINNSSYPIKGDDDVQGPIMRDNPRPSTA